ncbi:MAG: DUF1499 domain-containing protein [Deltaproteobacteria bacterium]|nr:DUF1499 domain-containing protein [Deltaproteobacteria bacterium]
MDLLAPLIADVATDVDDPLEYRVAGHAPMSARVRSAVRSYYRGLRSLTSTRPAREVFDAAMVVAKRQPRWRLHVVDPEDGFLEAVAYRRYFGLRDDVVIRVRSGDGETRVDMRSASRLGPVDFGVNAERIGAYLRQLGDELAARDPLRGPNAPW